MKILYYDCFSGISGNMNLGALVDLGVDSTYLIEELSKLGLGSKYEIAVKRGQKNGISGTKVDVIVKHEKDSPRNFQDIAAIIDGSGLSDQVKKSSLNMFRKIADAEAKVHGKPVGQVHFHEVGVIDSIIDLVGAAIALDFLKVDRIFASSVQVGGGFVSCAHGLLPVPAPATVELLKGVPIKSGIVPFETTTPTGAAILVCNVEKFTEKMDFEIVRTGYGLGTRDLEIPNVLRVYLGETCDARERKEHYLLETNIDDMNPEFYGYVEELLFKAGALDVFKTPIIMKKGRPAVKLSVLTNAEKERNISEILWKETTSIGLRKFRVEKVMLPGNFLTVDTKFGAVKVKVSNYMGDPLKYKAEYEDCRRIAAENHIPLASVYREVDAAMGKFMEAKNCDNDPGPVA